MHNDNKFLIPGEKVNLLVVGGYNSLQYISKVENVNPDGSIDVLIPISKNQLVYIKNDTLLKVLAVRETAIYEFKARIVDKLFGATPLIRLERVSDVTKIQRRNYYRLKVLKKIKVRRAINFKERLFEDCFTASLVDLSGGGAGFTSTRPLNENDIVEIEMELNSKVIRIFCRIVRKGYVDTERDKMYSYGAHFEKITEIERNSIMRFIFEEQRRLARRG